MSFYQDLTRDSNDILYQGKKDKNTPSGEAAFKLYNVSLSAAPKSTVTLNHTWTKQQDWKAAVDEKGVDAGKYDVAEKTATKVGLKHGDAKWDVTAANDKWSVKVGGPLVKDDWKVNGAILVENKPAKNETKVEVSSNVTSPELGGHAKVFVNATIDQTKKGKNSNVFTAKGDLNVNFNKEYFVGGAVTYEFTDDKQKKQQTTVVKDASVNIVRKDADSKEWLGYDVDDKNIKVGCLQHYKEKNFTHTYEGLWSLKKVAGLYGQPLVIAAGGKYVLSPNVNFTYSAELSNTVAAAAKYEYKVDSHWKLTIAQQFNAARVSNTVRPAHDLGFDIAYTL